MCRATFLLLVCSSFRLFLCNHCMLSKDIAVSSLLRSFQPARTGHLISLPGSLTSLQHARVCGKNVVRLKAAHGGTGRCSACQSTAADGGAGGCGNAAGHGGRACRCVIRLPAASTGRQAARRCFRGRCGRGRACCYRHPCCCNHEAQREAVQAAIPAPPGVGIHTACRSARYSIFHATRILMFLPWLRSSAIKVSTPAFVIYSKGC